MIASYAFGPAPATVLAEITRETMVNGWRKDRLPEIVRSMASRPRHEALCGLVTELLREGFGAAFSELEHERYLVGNEC